MKHLVKLPTYTFYKYYCVSNRFCKCELFKGKTWNPFSLILEIDNFGFFIEINSFMVVLNEINLLNSKGHASHSHFINIVLKLCTVKYYSTKVLCNNPVKQVLFVKQRSTRKVSEKGVANVVSDDLAILWTMIANKIRLIISLSMAIQRFLPENCCVMQNCTSSNHHAHFFRLHSNLRM